MRVIERFFQSREMRKPFIKGEIFCHPVRIYAPNWHFPNWHFPQLALFPIFFCTIENFSPEVPVHLNFLQKKKKIILGSKNVFIKNLEKLTCKFSSTRKTDWSRCCHVHKEFLRDDYALRYVWDRNF